RLPDDTGQPRRMIRSDASSVDSVDSVDSAPVPRRAVSSGAHAFVDPLEMEPRVPDDSPVLSEPTVRHKTSHSRRRLDERHRAMRSYVLRRVLIGVFIVAVVAFGVWLTLFSSVFRYDASQATVSGGNQWVDTSRINDIIDENNGKSLFLVNANDMASRIDQVVGVSDVTVQRQFPNTVSVSFTADTPAAVLHVTTDNELVPVNAEGEQLQQQSDESAYDGIPRIDVTDANAAKDDDAIAESVKVMDGFSDSLRPRVTGTTAPTRDSITSTIDDGVTVVWGDSSDIDFKVSVVEKIIAKKDGGDADFQSVTSINVSSPDSPIVK
ncbi:MAG: FtsQ-type POTRA domain-containing protein, partial [Bifidobacteriaceae bacterium]|nr:FtsQ-type POTRA domain-containing protein [Bifidobacteriaceae bacterium]